MGSVIPKKHQLITVRKFKLATVTGSVKLNGELVQESKRSEIIFLAILFKFYYNKFFQEVIDNYISNLSNIEKLEIIDENFSGTARVESKIRRK